LKLQNFQRFELFLHHDKMGFILLPYIRCSETYPILLLHAQQQSNTAHYDALLCNTLHVKRDTQEPIYSLKQQIYIMMPTYSLDFPVQEVQD